MITVQNITKTYTLKKQVIKALDDVSFTIKRGELFGLIGPDGAGKTSMFRILTTLLLSDSGSASVNGFDVAKDLEDIRKIVGYMPGKFSLYQDLTIEENLNFFADVFGTSVKENYAIIKDIYEQIEPFKKRRAGKLSGGMKQKLALCCALIHKPEILFLDEPTTGVDPVSRKEFWEILKNLIKQGITIMVSTPYMDEAGLCERIALLQQGKIMSINTPQQIINQYQRTIYAMKSNNNYQLLLQLRANPNVNTCYIFGEYLHVTFITNIPVEMPGVEIKKIEPGIEDCFISLMKK